LSVHRKRSGIKATSADRNLLNLPQYRIGRVEESEHDYHIFAEVADAPTSCQDCRARKLTRWGAREQLIKDLPIHGKRVGVYVNARRFRCGKCERTITEPLPAVSPERQMTERLVRWIGQQSLRRTFAALSEDTGVDEKTIRNIFRDYVNELEAKVRFEVPQWLGIDEIHIVRPRCVIANVEQRTIVNILPDRSKRTVTAYLHAFSGRDRVKYVAMDMWTPYRDAARAMLPQAKIVIDKFHVLRMANVAMEHVRKSLRASLPARERRGLMHDRFLLLKRRSDLNAGERLLVESWSSLHPDLGEAYRLKEDFFAIYDAGDRLEAGRRYDAWETSIPKRLGGAFMPIKTAWRSWREPILAYFDHPITNAYTESLNNLIEVIRNREANIRSDQQAPRRGYSFDAIRAAIVCDPRLHRVVDGVNYGVDIERLIAELRGHRRRRNGTGNGVTHGADDSVEILSERRRA
jgi:transposase